MVFQIGEGMKVVGVIAEYNPFHQGHRYQLDKIRELSQCDLLIVLMSGNVVQRGQFAILDKWSRAKIAVLEGADFVLELPLLVSLQGADYFAQGAVQLAVQVGCQELYFGTESATIEELEELEQAIKIHQEKIDVKIKGKVKEGLGYPAAYQNSLEEVIGRQAFDFSSPNHMLGLAYVRANASMGYPLRLKAIPRLKDHPSYFLSASQVRQAVKEGNLHCSQVGRATWQSLEVSEALDMDGYWPLLFYRLGTHTPASLGQILFVKEGLENRILRLYRQCHSWAELVECLVSKRWTRAAINRLLLAILCDIKLEEWKRYQQVFWENPILRLLAFRREKGPEIRHVKDHMKLKILSKSPDLNTGFYQLQGRCDMVMTFHPLIERPEQNIKPFPIGI